MKEVSVANFSVTSECGITRRTNATLVWHDLEFRHFGRSLHFCNRVIYETAYLIFCLLRIIWCVGCQGSMNRLTACIGFLLRLSRRVVKKEWHVNFFFFCSLFKPYQYWTTKSKGLLNSCSVWHKYEQFSKGRVSQWQKIYLFPHC